MSARSLRNIDNATFNREAYSNNLTQLKIGNLGEFNSIQNQVNILYSSFDLSGGGDGPIQDVINAINDISTEVDALQASQDATKAGILEIQQDISAINVLNAQVAAANADNIFVDSSNATVNANKTFQNGIAFRKMNVAGFVRNGADGSLSAAGHFGNVDFSTSANISQSKLATITSAGKVANRALSATSVQIPNAIAERNASGDVYVLQQPSGTNNFKVATNGFVISEFNRLVDNASTTLNTLAELANALGNDPNFFGNVNATLATKAPIIDASFSGNCRIAANIVVSTLNVSGIIRSDVNGNLYSSQLVANDLSGLTFYDSNLVTITTAGKVANSATSATYISSPSTIVLRDSSGNVFGNNVIGTMYSTIKDKDLSWNTWGYYPLSKTRAPVEPYAIRAWNEFGGSNIGNIQMGGMAWSPELKILVMVTQGNRFSYTYTFDLYNWVTLPSNDIYSYNRISWSRELGIFVAVGNNVLYSTTGTSWSREGVYIPVSTNVWSNICWSPELGMFVAVASSGGTNNRAMRSFDGKTWEISTTTNSSSWNSVCWAAELGIFVAVSGDNAMWSSNGLNWQLAAIPPLFSCNFVTWSPDLGIFCAQAVGSYVFLSTDGKVWKQYTTTGGTDIHYQCMWSREYKMFFGIGYFRHIYSFNGINWRNFNYNNTGIGNIPIAYIPECGNIFMCITSTMTCTTALTGIPSTYTIFDGPYSYTTEDGTQYFNQLFFNTNPTMNTSLNTYGISVTTLSSSQNVQIVGSSSRLIFTPSAAQNHVMTCINTATTANSGWTVPVGTRINAAISVDALATWFTSGAITRLGQITLPFGLWMVYYKISIYPTGGTDVVATQLIAGVSTSGASISFVAGSGSRYKDDFQRSLTAGRNTSYLPRTCRLSSVGTTYSLNAQLTFTATTAPTSIRANAESYMYAIKIQ